MDTKQLNDALMDPQFGASNQMKDEALKQIGAYMGMGLLGGAGVGALSLGGNLLGGDPAPMAPANASFVRVPVPVSGVERPRKRERPGPLKAAAAGMAAAIKEAVLQVTADLPKAEAGLSTRIGDAMQMFTPKGGTQGWLGGTLWPQGAANMWDMPGTIPLAMGGTALAAYGGYKGMQALAGAGQKAEMDAKLEEARKRYHAALLSNHQVKQAAAAPLDELAEKAAGYLAGPAGMYLALLGATGVGSGLAAYNYASEHSQSKAVEDALKRRRAMLAAESPPPVIAIPSPYTFDQKSHQKVLASPIRGVEPKLAAASPAEAARSALGNLQRRRQAYQQQMMAMQDGGKSSKPAKPAPPPPPKLPSLVS